MPSLKEARGACQETEFQTVDESSSGLRFAGWKKRNVSWALIAGDSEPRSQLLDVVICGLVASTHRSPGSIAEPFNVLAEMQQEGLIKHLGVITVTPSNSPRRNQSRRLSASRISTISLTGRMIRLSTPLPNKELLICRTSHSEDFHRCNPIRCSGLLPAWILPQ